MMRLALRQVADITDVISLPVFVDILALHLLPGDRLRKRKCLQNRATVLPTAAQIVNLATAWLLDKGRDKASHVESVDVVANLLAFVTVNPIGLPLEVTAHEVAEEAMQLNAGVIRSGQTTAAQTTGRHSEVASIF